MKRIIAFFISISMLLSVFPTAFADNIVIDTIPNLSSDFIMGMDISSIISEFNSGVTFKDYNGNTINNITDFCRLLADSGITHVRVRVWKNPYTDEGKGYGGGNNDVATAVKIAEGCAAAGIKMLIDFHCSDFWANSDKQKSPRLWSGQTIGSKETYLKNFISESLTAIEATGAKVAMAQVGNETTSQFIGENDAALMCRLFRAGAGVIHEHGAKAVIHITPEEGNMTKWAETLQSRGVDYDILATSYYPYRHGTLDNLKNEMTTIKNTYGKDVMIAETSYAYTGADFDGYPNTISDESTSSIDEPFTVQGQANAMRSIISAVNEAGGLGVFYWEPAWITVGDITGKTGDELQAQIDANRVKWETYGSGWATSFAADYDDYYAENYGGSKVDNQAMFYSDGTPTAAVKVFIWDSLEGMKPLATSPQK